MWPRSEKGSGGQLRAFGNPAVTGSLYPVIRIKRLYPIFYNLKGPTKRTLQIVSRYVSLKIREDEDLSHSITGFEAVVRRTKDFSEHEMGGILHLISDSPFLDLLLPPILHRELRHHSLGSTISGVAVSEDGSRIELADVESDSLDLWNRTGGRTRKSSGAGGAVIKGTADPHVLVLTEQNRALNKTLLKPSGRRSALRKRVSLVTKLGGDLLREKQDLLVVTIWPGWLLTRFNLTLQQMKLPMSLEVSMGSSLVEAWLRPLLTSYDESWKSDLAARMSEKEVSDLIQVDDQASSLTLSRIADKLDRARRQAGVKPATLKDSRLLKSVIEELGSDDRRTYARKRDLRTELDTLRGKDLALVLSDLLEERLRSFENSYKDRLIKEVEEAGLILAGEHPKYIIMDQDGSNHFEVDVRVPYGYVFVDGSELQNRAPQGVIHEVKRRLRRRGSFREVEVSQESFAEMALKVLDMITPLLGSTEVRVDALIEAITSFLEATMLRSSGSVGRPVKEWVARQIAEEGVWKAIVSRGWRFEAGKIGGVVLKGSGKRAVIMVQG